ncbi:MAG: hypothetical protein H0V30_10910 [Chitinophagaceae bacterium]|jgi:hypothetical protein|nr:hypothetical protein [Chitinophagaceae bacterium]
MKENVSALTHFLAVIRDDHRIGPTHISLYMSLFQMYNLNAFQSPVEITRSLVMETAKINGLATYHKCIRDLHEYGYIRYAPSFNPRVRSRIWMISG